MLHEGEGSIRTIKWRSSLIAWANNLVRWSSCFAMKYSTRVDVPFNILQTYIPNVYIWISHNQDFQRLFTNRSSTTCTTTCQPVLSKGYTESLASFQWHNYWFWTYRIPLTLCFQSWVYWEKFSIHFLSFFLSFFMYIRVSTTDPLPLHTSPHLGGYFGLKNWSKSLAVFLSDIKTLFKH